MRLNLFELACRVKVPQCLPKGKVKKNKTRLFSGLFLENPAIYLLQNVRGIKFFRIFRDMPLVDKEAIDDDAVSILCLQN